VGKDRLTEVYVLTAHLAVNGKRKHEEIDSTPQSSPERPMTATRPNPSSASFAPSQTPSKAVVKKTEAQTDEEVARRLAAELNTPRTRSAGSEKARPTKKAKTKKKSAALVGSDGEEVEAPKKAAKGGFQKEYALRSESFPPPARESRAYPYPFPLANLSPS
jgi:hypothetical protein